MRTCRRLILGLLTGLMLVSAGWAIDPQDFSSPAEEARYWELIEELRCLVCQNQNLADSNAPLAKDLRDQVLELMQKGMSNAEIKDYLVVRYGDFVLYNPPVKPATWGLWFGPLVIALLGAVGLGVVLRRRAAMDPAEIADPDQEELDRRLEALESEQDPRS